MVESHSFKTIPAKLQENIEEPQKNENTVGDESFFQKFRTPLTTQQNNKFDFANEKILLKQKNSNNNSILNSIIKNNKSVYVLFGAVFLGVLIFLIIIIRYLYASGDIKSTKTTELTETILQQRETDINALQKETGNFSAPHLQQQIQEINDFIQKEDYEMALKKANKLQIFIDKELQNTQDELLNRLKIQYYNYLSEIYYRLNNPQKSVFYSGIALKQTVLIYGKEALQTAKQYELMAFNFDNIGDFDKSLKLRDDAISIRLKEQDDDKIDEGKLIADMNNLGEEYRTLGRLPESKEILLKTISRIEKKYGIDAPELIIVLNNLGLTHQENNEKTIGLAFLQQGYQLAYKHYGNDHKLTRIITKNIIRLRSLK